MRSSPQNSVTVEHASDKKLSTFLENNYLKTIAINKIKY